MASKGKRKPSLHDLTLEFPGQDDLASSEAEVTSYGSSDRACALVISSIIDRMLVTLLATKMTTLTEDDRQPLFYGQTALLGSLSAKIRLSHALGLISTTQRDDMNTIREIRNTFAHSTKFIEFSNPLISKECEGLWPLDKQLPGHLQNMHVSKARYLARSYEILYEIILHGHQLLADHVTFIKSNIAKNILSAPLSNDSNS